MDRSTLVIPLPPVERLWEMYQEFGSVRKLEKACGISHHRLQSALKAAGYRIKGEKFAPDEDQIIREHYELAATDDLWRTKLLIALPQRHDTNINRRARGLGLTVRGRGWSEATRQNARIAFKDRWLEKPHPRGMLGKTHSVEERKRQSVRGRQRWGMMTEEQRTVKTLKMLATRVERGTLINQRPKTSWKSGWDEVGGKRCYFRSRWEFNFASYLEHLKRKGDLFDWEHEPKTFIFNDVVRGPTSYTPDFRVIECDGSTVYHEIKGWMDDRSKCKLEAIARTYPDIQLRLTNDKKYKALKLEFASQIPGWR